MYIECKRHLCVIFQQMKLCNDVMYALDTLHAPSIMSKIFSNLPVLLNSQVGLTIFPSGVG